MAWFAKSLVNSLKVLDDGDEEKLDHNNNNRVDGESPKDKEENSEHQIGASEAIQQGRGVKEDLSEITKTLTRQLWGVASFLAPPPSSDSSSPSHSPKSHSTHSKTYSSDPSISDLNLKDSSDQSDSRETSDPENTDSTATIAGIRSDFAEIGGKFKTGISKLSNHKAVTEISKIASNFLPFGSSEDISGEEYSVGGAVGVTDEVLTFANSIAMHPETWLDFPLDDDEDSDDFDMSDAQQEHALAVENLAPTLAALRMELCPGYMSEGRFWKIYFVLMYSRLSSHDAHVLSTPQIEETRAMLMPQKHVKTKQEPDHAIDTNTLREFTSSTQEDHQSSTSDAPSDTTPLETFTSEPKRYLETEDIEAKKHSLLSRETPIIEKTIVEEPMVQSKDGEGVTTMKVLDQTKSVMDEPAKDESAKDGPAKDDPAKDEPAKDDPAKDDPAKDEPSVTSNEVLRQTDEEDDADDWLKDSTETGHFAGASIPLGNDEDVSFSDLEED